MNQQKLLMLAVLLGAAFGFWSCPVQAQSRAVRFGDGLKIDAPTSGAGATLNFTTDTFTLEAWVKMPPLGSGGGNPGVKILGNPYSMNPGGGYLLAVGYNKITFDFYSAHYYWPIAAENLVLPHSQWHHVAVSKAGGVIRLYADGSEVGGDTLAYEYNIASSPYPFSIGTGGLDARIDEVKIWRGARTAAQIVADMAEQCNGPYPPALLAYYHLDESSSGATSTIACANNAALNATANGPVTSVPGAFALPAGTTMLYVDSAHVAAGCGTQGISWSTAFPDLNQALEAAQFNPGIREIHVAKGTYYPRHYAYTPQGNGTGRERDDRTGHASKTFHIRDGLAVYGGYRPGGDSVRKPTIYRTVLDGSRVDGHAGDTAATVVFISGVGASPAGMDTARLVGFTIRNGNGDLHTPTEGYGAGIYGNSSVVIEQCVVTDCYSTNPGSGVYLEGYARMAHDTITHNLQGGIHCRSSMDVSHSYIAYNGGDGIYSFSMGSRISYNEIAYNGGSGISDAGDTTRITGNHIHHNGGHGLFIDSDLTDTIYITGNLITDHHAELGGGIYLYGGVQQVMGNIILRDTAWLGGGIYCFNGYNHFKDNIIADNVVTTTSTTATPEGGGIYCNGYANILENNQILNNEAARYGGVYIAGSGTISGNAIIGNRATGQVGGAEIWGSYTVANNLVANNTASSIGGIGIWNYNDSLCSLVNNTFYNNAGTDSKGYEVGGLAVSNWMAVDNNIFWKNTAGGSSTTPRADIYLVNDGMSICRNNAFQLPAMAYPVIDSGENALGANATGNVFGVAPLWLNESNPAGPDGHYGTGDDGLQPAIGSPILDLGAAALLPPGISRDIRQAMRTYGAAPDMGAYELGCMPANTTSPADLSICKGAAATLSVHTAAPPQAVVWYADNTSATGLAAGYSFTTPLLDRTDTFWVGVATCADSARIPVRVYVNATIAQNGPLLQVDTGGTAYQWYHCDSSFQSIAGAEEAAFVATANGSYTVIATQNGCTDTADCVIVSGFEIPDAEVADTSQSPGGGSAGNGERLAVMPNPTTGHTEIAVPELAGGGMLILTNMQGACLYKTTVTSGQRTKLDLSGQPSGVYYLVVTDGTKQYLSKVVKR